MSWDGGLADQVGDIGRPAFGGERGDAFPTGLGEAGAIAWRQSAFERAWTQRCRVQGKGRIRREDTDWQWARNRLDVPAGSATLCGVARQLRQVDRGEKCRIQRCFYFSAPGSPRRRAEASTATVLPRPGPLARGRRGSPRPRRRAGRRRGGGGVPGRGRRPDGGCGARWCGRGPRPGRRRRSAGQGA